MNNNQEKIFHISSDTSTGKILALLDTVQSDNEDEIDELINDYNTEFIALEEFKLTGNLDNASVLTPEANFYVVDDEGTTHTKELERKRGKSWKKIPRLNGNATFLHILEEIFFLRVGFPANSTKCFSFRYL